MVGQGGRTGQGGGLFGFGGLVGESLALFGQAGLEVVGVGDGLAVVLHLGALEGQGIEAGDAVELLEAQRGEGRRAGILLHLDLLQARLSLTEETDGLLGVTGLGGGLGLGDEAVRLAQQVGHVLGHLGLLLSLTLAKEPGLQRHGRGHSQQQRQ